MPVNKNNGSLHNPLLPAKGRKVNDGLASSTDAQFLPEKNLLPDSKSELGRDFGPIETRPEPDNLVKKVAANAFTLPTYQDQIKPEPLNTQQLKAKRLFQKDKQFLTSERWSVRPSHSLTYVGLFLFTLTLYFRPYELIPALSGFSSMALVVAIATLVIYLPTQISNDSSLTIINTETKCILFLAFWAPVTVLFAADPGIAWKEYSEIFIKVLIIFVIMVNTVRTEAQLKGLILLGIAAGVMLSYQALGLYQSGVFAVEGYRVSVDFGGMFGNPNDMALHLVIFAPLALSLALGLRNRLARIICYLAAGVMVAGNIVTQSRGGFLGLLAVALTLIWKLGRGKRLKVLLISTIFGIIVVSLAPGNYGTRMISIFVPSMDPVGSSDQRRDLLEQSFWVTLRNPAGIGIGNFPIIGLRNLVTHNAYTQVSAELGWLAFIAYIVFLVSPLRKLGAIDRQLIARKDNSWIYYLSVGLQASIAGYMVASFFGSVAYQWYIYYPVAFAVSLRRIYHLKNQKGETSADNVF